MEVKEGFKVVSVLDGYPPVSYWAGMEKAVEYKIGEYTRANPGCNPALFYFKSFEWALQAVSIMPGARIYRCKARGFCLPGTVRDYMPPGTRCALEIMIYGKPLTYIVQEPKVIKPGFIGCLLNFIEFPVDILKVKV